MIALNPEVIAALDGLTTLPEPFSERAINALFWAALVAAGHEWYSPGTLELFERLWISSAVAAIEDLHEVHDSGQDTADERDELIFRIEEEILEAEAE